MLNEKKKGGFASGIGFVLAAAGSAVGLGNLWGFPFKTAENGGAAFVILYIACVLFIGFCTMICELFLGKRSQANPVTAFKKANPKLGWFGLIAIIVPFIISFYYSVLGGYTVKFAVNSFWGNTGNLANFAGSSWQVILCTGIFIAFALFIVMAGVKGGIEKASKILMPALFILLLLVVVFVLCLGEGVIDGLKFYLVPDWSKINGTSILVAMGQAFYSLSLGMGIMIAYGSYTGEEIKIGKSALMICIFDTLVALIAGLAIFTSIGHFNPNAFDAESGIKLSGVGLMYQTLPQVFASLGGFGQVVSFFFFAMVSIAAITSVISLLEVATQFVIQKFKVQRKPATLLLALICFIVSIPVAWSVGGAFDGKIVVFGFDMLTFFDEMTNTVLMPVGACLSCVVIGWLLEKGAFKQRLNPFNTLRALEEDGLSLGEFGKFFAVMVKYVTPLLILFLEVFGVIAKFDEYAAKGLNFTWVLLASIILMTIGIIVYFVFFRNTETGCNADELEVDAVKE